MGVHRGIQAELGPSLPSRGDLRFAALEAGKLAALIVELTTDGRGYDLQRAARTMEKLRAVVGPPADLEVEE